MQTKKSYLKFNPHIINNCLEDKKVLLDYKVISLQKAKEIIKKFDLKEDRIYTLMDLLNIKKQNKISLKLNNINVNYYKKKRIKNISLKEKNNYKEDDLKEILNKKPEIFNSFYYLLVKGNENDYIKYFLDDFLDEKCLKTLFKEGIFYSTFKKDYSKKILRFIKKI